MQSIGKALAKHWQSIGKVGKVPNLCNSVFGRHGLEPRQSQNGKFAIEQQKLRAFETVWVQNLCKLNHIE